MVLTCSYSRRPPPRSLRFALLSGAAAASMRELGRTPSCLIL